VWEILQEKVTKHSSLIWSGQTKTTTENAVGHAGSFNAAIRVAGEWFSASFKP